MSTVLDAFVSSFHVVFLTAAPITALGFMLAIFLREAPRERIVRWYERNRTNQPGTGGGEEAAGPGERRGHRGRRGAVGEGEVTVDDAAGDEFLPVVLRLVEAHHRRDAQVPEEDGVAQRAEAAVTGRVDAEEPSAEVLWAP